MASYTLEQLKGLTVAQLREIALGIHDDALEGFSTMHKEQLLPILCKVLNIPTHHIAVGSQKEQMKAAIRKLKADRKAAETSGKLAALPDIRHQIHLLKHKLRNMAEQKV